MIIFIVVVGFLVGGFIIKQLLYALGFIGAVGVTATQAYNTHRPLNDKEMKIMDEYDRRLRNGEMPQSELDYIIASQDNLSLMFAKYYMNTEFLFDLSIRERELNIEKLSKLNDPDGTYFAQIKKEEMDKEKTILRKQKLLEQYKDVDLDYYGNHGRPKEE